MTKEQKKFLTNTLSKFILRDHGRAFHMSYWRRLVSTVHIDDPIPIPIPACGTICCIGGSAAVLLGKTEAGFRRLGGDKTKMASLLGLTYDQVDGLFYYWHLRARNEFIDYAWPHKFAVAYEKAKTPLGRAKVAVRLLKEVARTNGECLKYKEAK